MASEANDGLERPSWLDVLVKPVKVLPTVGGDPRSQKTNKLLAKRT